MKKRVLIIGAILLVTGVFFITFKITKTVSSVPKLENNESLKSIELENTSQSKKSEDLVIYESNNIINESESPVDYEIVNNIAYRLLNGQKEEIKSIKIKKTGESGRQYFILDTSNPFRLSWEKNGTYFFDPNGKYLFHLPVGQTQTSMGLFFSPNENYVAEDEGTWVIRDLLIYTFPDLKKIGSIRYYEDFVWKQNNYIYFTTIGEKEKPILIDSSEFRYVAVINLKNGKIAPVKLFDDLSEYHIQDIEEDFLVVKKVYVDNFNEWEDASLWKEEKIKIPNPISSK